MGKIKEKWLEALRGGTYTQGFGGLKRNGAHCCLGVLCDQIDPTGWRKEYDRVESYKQQFVFPPDEILDQADLSFSFAEELARLNDKEGFSFTELADYIEKHL